MLLYLPDSRSAKAVAAAMIAKLNSLPIQLRRSVTWDQGIEMARHEHITAATGIDIHFCDPRSPWQRGTNETPTAFYTSTSRKDSHAFGPGYLDTVAAELSNRPRKPLAWRTPSEALNQLLSRPSRITALAAWIHRLLLII